MEEGIGLEEGVGSREGEEMEGGSGKGVKR